VSPHCCCLFPPLLLPTTACLCPHALPPPLTARIAITGVTDRAQPHRSTSPQNVAEYTQLNLALVALVVFVLKKPLPEFTYYLEGTDVDPAPTDGRGGRRSLEMSGSFEEYVDGGRGGVRMPAGSKQRSSEGLRSSRSVDYYRRRSMDFYRSITEFSKKKTSAGTTRARARARAHTHTHTFARTGTYGVASHGAGGF
jgi:hypothetical protein